MAEVEKKHTISQFAVERYNLRSLSDSRASAPPKFKKSLGSTGSLSLHAGYLLRPRGYLRRRMSDSDVAVQTKLHKTDDSDRFLKSESPRGVSHRTPQKEILRGDALEQLYDDFIHSYSKAKKSRKGIHGFQLNDLKDIIYVYVEKGKKALGETFVKEDEYLSTILNVEVVVISGPTDLSCLNCNTPDCESLSGNLDLSPKSWIGLGSAILALPKVKWEEVPSKFSTLKGVTEFLKENDVIYKKWSLGCHLLTENCNQVAITSYHPLIDFPAKVKLVFLTEVLVSQSPERTQVKVLCDEYIHQDPRTLNESQVGQYDLDKCHNILVLTIKKDVIDLLKNKLKECDMIEKEFTLICTKSKDLGYSSIVGKRGATTGTTYGELIATKVHLGSRSASNTLTPAFAVGSIPVSPTKSIPFAKPGDSGSLVFRKVDNARTTSGDANLNLKADGLVWRNQELKNNRTNQMDYNATASSRLGVNLRMLAGGPYQNLRIPPTNPSVSFYSQNEPETVKKNTN